MKITPVTKKDGTTGYRYDFWLYGKHKRGSCKGCKNMDEAKEYVALIQKQISDTHRGLIDMATTLAVKEMFDELLVYTKQNNSLSHIKNQTRDSERFIDYFSAETVIADITPQMIEDYRTFRLKTVSKNTVNHEVMTLSKAFNVVTINHRLRLFNPCRAIRKYHINNKSTRVISKEEYVLLKANLCEHLQRIVLVLFQTGLRPKQVFNLLWQRIHLDVKNPYIEVLATDIGNKSKKYYTVPVSSILQEALKEWGVKPEGYVFINDKTGKPYTTIKTGFKNACRRAGIKNLTVYDIKHTVGSIMASKGVAGATIQGIFNHSDPRVTDRYVIPLTEDIINAVETLSDFN